GRAHRLGKGCEQLRLDNPVLRQLEILGRVLEHKLRDRENDRELGPREAAVFLGAADALFTRSESLDLAIEPASAFQQLDGSNVARKRLRPARFRDRKSKRLEAVILADNVRELLASLQ